MAPAAPSLPDEDFQGDGIPTEEIVEFLGEEGAGTCPNETLRAQLEEGWRIYRERAAADIEFFGAQGDTELVGRVESNLIAAQAEYDQATADINNCHAATWYWP